MLAYAMVQEHATWLNYRNLRQRVLEQGGDPALAQLLLFLAVDEKAHHCFFRDCVKLYLQHDRPAMLDQLRRVMNNFAMPAIYEFADSHRRIAAIRELNIFDENMYYGEVYLPLLRDLGVERAEMRQRLPSQKTLSMKG
jgi:acyl-[acyl-carrier-protein] desaturase